VLYVTGLRREGHLKRIMLRYDDVMSVMYTGGPNGKPLSSNHTIQLKPANKARFVSFYIKEALQYYKLVLNILRMT